MIQYEEQDYQNQVAEIQAMEEVQNSPQFAEISQILREQQNNQSHKQRSFQTIQQNFLSYLLYIVSFILVTASLGLRHRRQRGSHQEDHIWHPNKELAPWRQPVRRADSCSGLQRVPLFSRRSLDLQYYLNFIYGKYVGTCSLFVERWMTKIDVRLAGNKNGRNTQGQSMNESQKSGSQATINENQQQQTLQRFKSPTIS